MFSPQQKSKWISVKDRLPSVGEQVISYGQNFHDDVPMIRSTTFVTYSEGSVGHNRGWNNGMFKYIEGEEYFIHSATHWLPISFLPPLPQSDIHSSVDRHEI